MSSGKPKYGSLYESPGFTLTKEKQGLMGEVPVIEERWDLVLEPEE